MILYKFKVNFFYEKDDLRFLRYFEKKNNFWTVLAITKDGIHFLR